MTRADLRSLPKESEKRIELVRARHEVKIREAFQNWRREKRGTRPSSLTAQQQSELQALLVARSVELGEAEGRERLSVVLDDPSQLEIETHSLEEIFADEARDRWKSLTSGFHLEPSLEGVYADAERGVYSRVRELLRASFDDLMLEAWSAHEKRLEAECEGDGCKAPLSKTPELSDVAKSSKVAAPAISGVALITTTGQAAADGHRLAAENTAAASVKSATTQRPGKERKGDATLLADNLAVTFRTAEQYLGITERQRQNLVNDKSLKVVGKGHNRKITTESLRNCLLPEIPK
jgi:hypothetical protein